MKNLNEYTVEYYDGVWYRCEKRKAFSKFELLETLRKECPQYSPFNIERCRQTQDTTQHVQTTV